MSGVVLARRNGNVRDERAGAVRRVTRNVLLAVDDKKLRQSNEAGLRGAGFNVAAPTDGQAADLLAESFSPDVMVVDTAMAAPDGRPLYKHLRKTSGRYMLCIDTSGRDRVRMEALSAGADDVVSLPVSPDEVAARCHALMRRPRELRSESGPAPVISFGPLTVDTWRHEIRLNGQEVIATVIEFALLEYLSRRQGGICTRTEMIEAVWGPHWAGEIHVVDVHLFNLRTKLRKVSDVEVIRTVRGVGFRIDA